MASKIEAMSSPVVSLPGAVQAYFTERDLGVVAEDHLTNGAVNLARRLTLSDGTTAILKQGPNPPAGMYAIEAESLDELRVPGGPRAPKVYSVGDDHLLLEDLGNHDFSVEGFWEKYARALATLHSHQSPKFGYHKNNYLGLLVMDNAWTEDGHEFFGRTRILRFLEVPLCYDALTPEDRRRVERVARRLPEFIPKQPACLLHGDLWWANMLISHSGEPAFIDPGIHYGWPEAELAMTLQCGRVPEAFFAVYREINPVPPGWDERLHLLGIKEELSMTAHFGDRYSLEKLRILLDRFA